MPLALGVGIVLEGRAIVQDPAVIDEEHLARPQGELDPEVGARQHPVERVQGVDLFRGEWLVRLLVAGLDPVAEVAKQQLGTVPGDHRELHRGRLARLHTPPAIDVERPCQGVECARVAP